MLSAWIVQTAAGRNFIRSAARKFQMPFYYLVSDAAMPRDMIFHSQSRRFPIIAGRCQIGLPGFEHTKSTALRTGDQSAMKSFGSA
jgi:hypothetical protein